jgi:glycosyltransferase involved in cell wall biosynthesis
MTPLRTAFVMEQALGHVTHARNLQATLRERSDVAPTWLPIPFEVSGASRVVPLLRSNWSVRASWRARRALNATLASQPHAALVFHTQVTSLFSVGLMRRIPSLISLDATPINYDKVGQYYGHRPAGNGLLDRRKYQMNRDAFHAAAVLVAWSDWARASLIDDYGVDSHKISVLAPGAAQAYFDIGARRLPHAPIEPVRILFVGGDFDRKGGQDLLDSFGAAAFAQPAELHLVTNCAVDESHANTLVHRGLRPNSPELLRLFEAADVFVLPSYAECLAVVLMEATAAGLPVITTSVGALGEAVHPGRSGLLVQPGDTAALRRALELLVDDASVRQRMGREGHAVALRKFDAQHNNHSLLDLVVTAADAKHTARRAA